MKITKDDVFNNVIDDCIRFGAAIGSWSEGKVRWHQQAGCECIVAIREAAIREIQSRINNIEADICHHCHQKLPEETDG